MIQILFAFYSGIGREGKLYELKSYIKLWVTDESSGALHLGAWMLWAGRRRRPQWTCPSSRSAWACGTWSATCTRRPSTWSTRTGRTGCGPWRTGRTSSRRRWAAPSASPFHSPPGKPVPRGDSTWHLALSDQSSRCTVLACRNQALESGEGCHFCQCLGNSSPHAPAKDRVLLSPQPSRHIGHSLHSSCFVLLMSKQALQVSTWMQVLPAPGSCPRSTGSLCWDRGCPGEGHSAKCQAPTWTQRPHCFLLLILSFCVWFYFTKVLPEERKCRNLQTE